MSGGCLILRDNHAILLSQSLRSSDIDTTRIALAAVSAANALTLPGNFDKLGKAARIRAHANPDNSTPGYPGIRSFRRTPPRLISCASVPDPLDRRHPELIDMLLFTMLHRHLMFRTRRCNPSAGVCFWDGSNFFDLFIAFTRRL